MAPYGPRGSGRSLSRALVYVGVLLAANILYGLAILTLVAALGGRDALSGESGGSGVDPELALALTVLFAPVILLITHIFLRRWDHCPWRELFKTWDARSPVRGRWLRHLGAGYLAGGALLGALLGLFALAGWFSFEGWGDAASRGAGAAALQSLILFAAFFLQGGAEEVAFRGYLFRNLGLWRGLVPAIVISSLVFGLVHGLNPGASIGPLPLVNTAVVGVLLALVRVRYSLWMAVGFHAVWNLSLAHLSLPISGIECAGLLRCRVAGPRLWTGAGFGPEASLLTTLLVSAGCVVLILAIARRRSTRAAPSPDRPAEPFA
jgi:membrane protease YdiL (CAAX protease family)